MKFRIEDFTMSLFILVPKKCINFISKNLLENSLNKNEIYGLLPKFIIKTTDWKRKNKVWKCHLLIYIYETVVQIY